MELVLRLLWLVPLLFCSRSWGGQPDFYQLSVRSHYDHFVLKRHGDGWYLGQDKVDLGTLKEFLPLFATHLTQSCPEKMGAADLTVQALTDKGIVKRQFFIGANQMKGERSCAEVHGNGIYFLPLSRRWFSTDAKGSVKFGHQVTIERPGHYKLHFFYKDADWRDDNQALVVNWDFFHQVREALESFTISLRALPGLVKKPPDFTVTTRHKTYAFYKLDQTTWLLQRPKAHWLLSSSAFSVFGDMDLDQWKDSRSQSLNVLLDSSKKLSEREAALATLKDSWSKAIKSTYRKIMLNAKENNELKGLVAEHIKFKPSNDNFTVLVQALSETTDLKLQSHITKILRIRDPKGPALSPETADQAPRVINYWKKWANGLKKHRQ